MRNPASWTRSRLILAATLAFGLVFSAWALPGVFVMQQDNSSDPPSTPAWVIWETGRPLQRLLVDDSAFWTGGYKGGLFQWDRVSGPARAFSVEQGLSGEDVISVARDSSGNIWAALLDGGLVRIAPDGSVTDQTPPQLAGKQPWDVAVHGTDVWLASLGGGVAHYANGAWTTYTTATSAIPSDDVYAITIAPDGTPWIGTLGLGVASFQNGAWVSYDLPVTIADPRAPSRQISNDAILDIAIDSAGNTWFATDGSGVVALERNTTQYTVYNTANSNLASDFVQRIAIDQQGNYWFATLGGGVNRLSADRATWQTYTTSNSPLTEDDILDVGVDDQHGLWLAAYDTGLAYYGGLPATPPSFALDSRGQPTYTAGATKGYYLWLDPATYIWTLAWSSDGTPHTFSGSVAANGPIALATLLPDVDEGDSAQIIGNSLQIDANETNGEDRVTFTLDRAVTELTIHLQIDGAYYPFNMHIGEQAARPGTAPFRLVPPQPQPPVVTVSPDQTVGEGEYVFIDGDYTDADSLTGHSAVWSLGDGTIMTDTLAPTHIYADDGVFAATLTVTDVHGLAGAATTTITVENVAPEVEAYADVYEPAAGETVTFSGSIFDPGIADTHTFTWDFGDGSPPVTSTEITATHTFAAAGTFTATLTVTDDDGGVGSSMLQLQVPDPLDGATLTLTPSSAGPNVTGTQQALTATLRDRAGMVLSGVPVQFTVVGPNATSSTAITDDTGVATFTYTGTAYGTDAIRATAGAGSTSIQSNPASVTWITPVQPISSSTVWGRFFFADGSGAFKATPGTAPVFDQLFPVINFNPPSGSVPGNTSGVAPGTTPFTNVTTDLNGNYSGTIVAQGNGYKAGVGQLYSFDAVFTGEFVVAAAGDITFRFYHDDGFVFGVGNGATRVSGVYVNAPSSGRTAFENLPVMGAYNQVTAPTGNTVTVHFPAPGIYPYELDYSQGPCCHTSMTMTTAASNYTGVPPSGSLILTPNAVAARPSGQAQAFSVTVTDASGQALGNQAVVLHITGANPQQLQGTTDAAGKVTFSYVGSNTGWDLIQARTVLNGRESVSNEVQLQWTQ